MGVYFQGDDPGLLFSQFCEYEPAYRAVGVSILEDSPGTLSESPQEFVKQLRL